MTFAGVTPGANQEKGTTMNQETSCPDVRSAFDLRAERRMEHPPSAIMVARGWMTWLDDNRFDGLGDILCAQVEWSDFPAPSHEYDRAATKTLVCKWLRELGYVVRSTFRHVVILLPAVHRSRDSSR